MNTDLTKMIQIVVRVLRDTKPKVVTKYIMSLRDENIG
jgi:hypothetical protein